MRLIAASFQSSVPGSLESCGYCNCTGKRKVKRCAPSGVRSGPDAATMRRDNGTGNCQPQTCTLSLCGEEWIKNLVDMVSAQSQASVSDRDQQLTIPGPTAP